MDLTGNAAGKRIREAEGLVFVAGLAITEEPEDERVDHSGFRVHRQWLDGNGGCQEFRICGSKWNSKTTAIQVISSHELTTGFGWPRRIVNA